MLKFIYQNLLPSISLILMITGCSHTKLPPQSAGEDFGSSLGFKKYSIETKDDIITYFYKKPQSSAAPLIVVTQGSGCSSQFWRAEDGGVRADMIARVANFLKTQDVAILGVEKIGVKSFKLNANPGTAVGCPDEFLRRYSFKNWVPNVSRVLDQLEASGFSPQKVLVIGHSEGAESAAAIAGHDKRVTHVAHLSGGGAIQLYDFLNFGGQNSNMGKISSLFKDWDTIEKNKEKAEPLVWGHSPHYWYYSKQKGADEYLKDYDGELYLVHGDEDKNSSYLSYLYLLAYLKTHNKRFTYKIINGADHGYQTKKGNQFNSVVSEALKWFVGADLQ